MASKEGKESSFQFSDDEDYASNGESSSSHDKNVQNESDKSESYDDIYFIDRVKALNFQSIKDAEEAYISYGRIIGFDVRKNTVKKDKITGQLLNREFLCYREGHRREILKEYDRKRVPKEKTRCGCSASFRVAFDRVNGGYKVTRFQPHHNHPLETSESSHVLRCNRYLTPSTRVMLDLMIESGFRPSRAMGLVEKWGGGGCTGVLNKKDGYNYLNNQRLKRIEGGDVNSVLGILEGMKLKDKALVFKHSVDESGALTRLFWCDGMSRAEYELYGDVILFDSTYKTNKYEFPLVIFSGVNSHLATCVFGVAIMYSETIESYQWLLRTFRKSMNGKAPNVVLTDQDPSMRTAVENEFPYAIHRLCCWHISRNAEAHVKTGDFSTEFSSLMNRRCSVAEFEIRWKKLIEEYDVADNNWIKDIYSKREQWAEAYFQGHFFAMMRSTQRAESLNSLLKQRVRVGSTLTDLFRHFHNDFLKGIRKRFSEKQIQSEKPLRELKGGPLRNLENHAARICTRAIFDDIRDQIKLESDIIVDSKVQVNEKRWNFIFNDHTTKNFRIYSTIIDLEESKFDCDCLMLQSDGIPCRHLICGFKNLTLSSFPNKSINSRWFVDVGRKLRLEFPFQAYEDPESARFGKMSMELMNLAKLFSHDQDVFDNSMEKIREMAAMVQNKFESSESDDNKIKNSLINSHNVLDPEKIIPKGGTKGKRHCSKCSETGHNASTCEKRKRQNVGNSQ